MRVGEGVCIGIQIGIGISEGRRLSRRLFLEYIYILYIYGICLVMNGVCVVPGSDKAYLWSTYMHILVSYIFLYITCVHRLYIIYVLYHM